MDSIFATLAAWITSVVKSGGYLGVAFLVLLENLFPPIPSELILPVAGFLVGQGQLVFAWVVVAATVGSVVGALLLYELGRQLSERRLRGFIRLYGKWLLLHERDVDTAQRWFARHGSMAVLLGRLVPSVRSLISIPAGLARMPLLRFVFFTTLGSAIWNTALVGTGWWLGAQWHLIEPYLQRLEWVVLALLGAGLAWFIWSRLRTSRQPVESRRR